VLDSCRYMQQRGFQARAGPYYRPIAFAAHPQPPPHTGKVALCCIQQTPTAETGV